MFGPWVEFGQGGNGILLEARDLDAPLPGSDPAMARHVKPYLEPILSQADATLSEQGRWVVYTCSSRTPPGSCRDATLPGRCLNAVRNDLARRYVEDK